MYLHAKGSYHDRNRPRGMGAKTLNTLVRRCSKKSEEFFGGCPADATSAVQECHRSLLHIWQYVGSPN